MLSASVIIANWNGAHHLRVCLDSLRRQTHQDFEVIVVDNGSTDGSVEMVQKEYPEVHLLALDDNYGFIVACNRGAQFARGEVLVMLNNDTEVEPQWLEALCRALEQHPEAGSAASKMLLFERRDTLHSAGDMLGPDFMPMNRGVWEIDQGQYDADLYIFGPCGGAAAYRRELWEQLGGFDERLFMYLEDVDLAWRAQRAGWKSIFVPEARVYHHLSATGGGTIASYYVGRNTILLHRRYLGGRDWLKALPGHARVAWEALRAWRGEAARARLRGILHGILGLEGKRHR
ncbi:MAG: glycosyltransferase family 2 protein [Caldilineae bacterium]|nr:MAG: glycosyltransferase family 2 protein [Caldilineae bacterium]